MIKLNDKNIIEYETKMLQFRNQLNRQKQAEEVPKPDCPHCQSTNTKSISGLNRGVSIAM